MKKILELNNVVNLNISGGLCDCSCLGDEYENRGKLLALIGTEFHEDRCAYKCKSIYLTANSHCEYVVAKTDPLRIIPRNL